MNVIVCPLDAVAEACLEHAPTHIVSLLAPPAAAPVVESEAARLHLSFNDIVVATDSLTAPSAAHIQALLAFLADWDGRSPLLIHCWAGVSRSTAAGYIAATLRDGVGSEDLLAARLRQAAPFATPNALMVALADQALVRNGAMTAAIAAIGRGAEAHSGCVFRL